jgi:hypothetical protein
MKLCPQCDFIYEDDQGLCDMDGKELVYHPAPVAIEQSVVRPTRLTIDLPARSHPRRFPILLIGAVVLATLLSVIYFAQLHRSRSSKPDHSAVQASGQSTARDVTPQIPADSAGAVGATSLSEQSPVESFSWRADGAALGVSPASDQSSALKRSQVRAIERPASPSSRSTLAAGNTENQNRKAQNAVAENRLRTDRLETPDTKKDSRVTSFLKKTGRILKKPFKF